MTSFATRRRRRRRIAIAAGGAILLAVLAIVTGLWRQAVHQTHVAEGSKLITLGHLAVGEARTDALAYAIAALGRADTSDARRLAVAALWAGPPKTVVSAEPGAWPIAFSDDGSRMVVGHVGGALRVYSRDGGPPVELDDFEGTLVPVYSSFSPDGSRLVSGAYPANGEIRLWNTDDWRVERILSMAEVVDGVGPKTFLGASGIFEPDGRSLLSFVYKIDHDNGPAADQHWIVHRWRLDDGEPSLVGALDVNTRMFAVDVPRDVFVVGSGNELLLHRLSTLGHTPPRVILRHSEPLDVATNLSFDPSGERMAICFADHRLFVWRIGSDDEPLILEAPTGDCSGTAFSPDGSLLAQASDPVGGALWDLQGPAGAEPLSLDGHASLGLAFTPDGRWLATSSGSQGLAIWPITGQYSRLLRGHDGAVRSIEFSTDGSVLYTQGSTDGKVLAWPLTGDGVEGPIVVHQTEPAFASGLAVDPHGRFLIVATQQKMWHVPLDGGAAVPYDFRDLDSPFFHAPTLDRSGRFLAAAVNANPNVVVLDLESGRHWELAGPGEGNASPPYFDADSRLLITRGGIASRWDPVTESTETLFEDVQYAFPHPDGRVLVRNRDGRWLVNLDDGSRTEFRIQGHAGGLVSGPGLVGLYERQPRRDSVGVVVLQTHTPPLARPRGPCVRTSRVAGWEVDRHPRRRRNRASVADARFFETSAPHPVPRQTDGEAEDADKSAGRAKRRVLHRVPNRTRPHRQPRLGRGAGVVK